MWAAFQQLVLTVMLTLLVATFMYGMPLTTTGQMLETYKAPLAQLVPLVLLAPQVQQALRVWVWQAQRAPLAQLELA
jgi:hypothetical protein